MISVMPLGKTIEEKGKECRDIAKNIKSHQSCGYGFRQPPLLVMNISCPNTGEKLTSASDEAKQLLDVFAQLDLSVVVKVAVTMPVEQAFEIARHPNCAGIHVTNTVPWAELSEKILKRVFPDCWDEESKEWVSPLAEFGGGGYSGKDLLPMVARWVYEARQMGMEKPIIAGGGIFSGDDVFHLRSAGADVVSVASPVILRPWKIPGIVAAAWLYDVVEKRRA